ncbi:hypothetical protein D3C80_1014060 [compost metagenome]
MKKFLLSLLLLTSLNFYSQALTAILLVTPTPCNGSNFGQISVVATGGTLPYSYRILPDPLYQSDNVFNNLSAGTYTIEVKDANNNFSLTAATIEAPSPIVASAAITKPIDCISDATITLTATGGTAPYTYSINNSPYQPENYFSNLTAGTYNVIAKDAKGCIASTIVAITQPNLLSTAITITDQTVTTNATGGTPPYIYSLDGTIYSTENTFSNLATGTYSSWAKDTNGCIASLDFVINAPAPLINDSNTITLSLVPGQTLADIIVEGENIKWYSTPGISTGKIKQTNKKVGETPLPLSTVLVDNTTYYASQTINGIESAQRLAVTVQLNALATPDFVLTNFKSYPNPVKNNLTIQNTSTIDEITLYSITGETVLTKKIKTLRSEIDLSALSSGIYFLKVKSEGEEKTVRIVKE